MYAARGQKQHPAGFPWDVSYSWPARRDCIFPPLLRRASFATYGSNFVIELSRFRQLTPRTCNLRCKCFVHASSGIKNAPYGAFFYPGGDEGIRTLDTVDGILHFQCSALDQLCDVSEFLFRVRRCVICIFCDRFIRRQCIFQFRINFT